MTLPDKYQLIRVKNDTLYILDRGLDREEIEDFKILLNEDDCDRINPLSTYAVSDSDMTRIFGR